MPRRLLHPAWALLVLVAAEAHSSAGSVLPHHSHTAHSRSTPQAKAWHHERQTAIPKAPEHKAVLLEQTQHESSKSVVASSGSTVNTPMCRPNAEIFQQVVANSNRRIFFKEEDAVPERIFGIPEDSLPRACAELVKGPQCCTKMWYERLHETTGRTKKEFEYVRDQYFHFKEDTIAPALKAAKAGSPEVVERLESAAKVAKQGIDRVLDFIDLCEDPLRLFFASTACALCTPGLDKNLTEEQILHVSKDSLDPLAKDCSAMPDKLREAGKSFIQAHAILTEGNTCEERWYVHAQSWLDRAAKLTLLRSKDIRPKYVKSTFQKAIAAEGFVYRPEQWGDALLLHISVLATEEERETFVPQDELRYFVPQEGKMANLREKAQTILDEFADEGSADDGSATNTQVNGNQAGNNTDNNANSLSQLGERTEEVELECVHGRKMRYHCQCDHCWTGVNCDKKMAEGPARNQDFEPLVAQVEAGAHQGLALQGCQLHTDLRHQLAHITLIQIPEAAEGRSKPEDLCKKPLKEDYSNSLRLQIPELVSPREYVYLIDEPIGQVAKYEVCYCYGVDCMDTRTLRPNNCTSADCNTGDVLQGWKTPESLQGWFSVGQVEVVNTKEDRDAIVRKMFELPALKARRIRETPPKLCSTDWYLQDNDTFYFVRRHNTVVFKCNDGFANLKGVEELHCDDGQWKVAKHSEDNPMEEKLSPPDMAVWEPGQFPECSWALADTCKSDDPLNVVSKRSPPVMNDFSGDGLVHYRCGLISGNPARLVIKGATAIKKGEEVIYNGREVGQVVGHEGPKYQIKLVDSGKQLTVQPDLLEWLPQATSFVRRCGPDKKYVPADVEIRCLLVLPSDAPDSVAGDFSSAGFATEQQAAKMAAKAKGQAKPPAASLLEQSSSSLLEASAAGASHTGEASLLEQRSSSLLKASAAGASHSWEAQEAVDSSLQLQLQPWPVMLSEDAEYVLHVDSCWISAINCSDGTVAKDTVRALQRTPVALDEMPPPVVEDAIQLSWGLAGCVALALVLLLMLLGWSSQRPRETGKRGTPK